MGWVYVEDVMGVGACSRVGVWNGEVDGALWVDGRVGGWEEEGMWERRGAL